MDLDELDAVADQQERNSREVKSVSTRPFKASTLMSFWGKVSKTTKGGVVAARSGVKRKRSVRASSEETERERDVQEQEASSSGNDETDKDEENRPGNIKSSKPRGVNWAPARETSGVVGVSRSNKHSISMNELVRKDLFSADPVKLARFKTSILRIDDRCEFRNPDIGKTVHHLPCNTPIEMKEPYNTTLWTRHMKSCKGRPPLKQRKVSKVNSMSIMDAFAVTTPASRSAAPATPRVPTPPPPEPELAPCPGVSAERYPSVDQYLRRTGALGGGARSVTAIALATYGKVYKLLNQKRKQQVRLTRRHEWRWRNEHGLGRVYAVGTCEKTVAVHAGEEPSPCRGCLDILHCKAFKRLANVPIPPDNDRACNNEEYKNGKLVELYGKFTGLSEILEHPVSHTLWLEVRH